MHLIAHPAQQRAGRSSVSGFTLLELLVTVSLLGILLALTLPSFTAWIRNTRVRTTADALQNGLRLAQAEAIRRNRQVLFSLTNATPDPNAAVTVTANGNNWVIWTVPVPGESASFVQGGSLGSASANLVITGPASLCFNSFGRLAATTPTAGITCTVPSATPITYVFKSSGYDPNGVGDRLYNVTVALGGQIRLCDANRSIATSPDGCS